MSYQQIGSDNNKIMSVHLMIYSSVQSYLIDMTIPETSPLSLLIISRQADDDDLDALSFAPNVPLPRTPEPYGNNATAGPSGVSGRIGSSGSGQRNSTTREYGGVKVETRYTGESTLDEPVSATIVN